MRTESLPFALSGWLLFLLPVVSAGAEPVDLQRLVDRAVTSTLERFASAPKKLLTNQLAVSLVDLNQPNRSAASYRGDVPIYPASVIKLFYLAAAHRWLEDGRLEDTAELRRALNDMIVDSSNEATHYIIDLLTGTTSGPELPEPELDLWFEKRNAVTRYFASLGYTNVIANKKPWCEGPYGRESQSIRRQKPSRNMLSTDDTARLLTEMVKGQCISPSRSAAMLELLKRDPAKPLDSGGEPSQDNAFTGLALRGVPGARLWSKAGLTSQVRHDAAYVQLDNGSRFILVTYTEGHANERGIIQAVAQTILREFRPPAPAQP
jgi:beta-lactamase class A